MDEQLAGPVMPVTDAAVLAHSCGGVLFVVGAEMTPRQAAVAAIEQIRGAGGQFVGAVLNRVNVHRHSYYYAPYYRVQDDGISIPPGEQTVMGLGIVGAIGAKLARPDMHVVCTCGDGAMQMVLGELASAVQHRAPVTWVVRTDNLFERRRLAHDESQEI